jgi:hypothetical protein
MLEAMEAEMQLEDGMATGEALLPAIPSIADDRMSTVEDRASRAHSVFSVAMVLLAVIAVSLSVALTVRAYMPCPWLDEWRVMADIAGGARPWSWHWLWSQHGEHRIAITRTLIWLDWAAFGGRNMSLFVEIYLVQITHLAAICYALERFSDFPKPLKRMLEGVFAFCLLHPYQAQNLTWSFQVTFVLAFAIGTVALLGVTFLRKISGRWRRLVVLGVALAPIAAAANLASGLLVGPAVIIVAWRKGLPHRVLFAFTTLWVLAIFFYFHAYSTPAGHPSPLLAMLHPWRIVRYALALLDASWHFFFAAAVSLVCLIASVAAAVHRRKRASDFEWFCIAQCSLMLATALLTACGRYGIAQAGESRYQTLAMIYWASLFSLVIIAVWRWYPEALALVQMAVVLITLSSLLFLPPFWNQTVAQSDLNRQACASVISGKHDAPAEKRLDFFADDPRELRHAAAMLRERWTR